jgi:hypothetical protein
MKRYPFKFIARQGWAGVVEIIRDDNTERCLLPMDMITGAKELTGAQVDAGIPYGLQFGEFLKVPHIETALHNAGVWTLQDLYTKAQIVVSVLQAVSSLKLSEIIQLAESYEKNHTVSTAATVAHKTKRNKEKYHE